MRLRIDWDLISARISALQALVGSLGQAANAHGPVAVVGREIDSIIVAIRKFQDVHTGSLCADIIEQISVADRDLAVRRNAALPNEAWPNYYGISLLSTLASQVTYLLSSHQDDLRSTALRALEHLKRLIVVDEDVRKKWKIAFDQKGETACEGLASAHLLWHGIWAFKCDGKKAVTDLIFQDAPFDHDTARVLARGMVLTEWKVCGRGDNAKDKFEAARNQAEKYVGGVLGGIELTAYRFAVVVSEKAIELPGRSPI